MNNNQPNYLSGWAQFALFGSSYTPLLIVLLTKILIIKSDYLHWGGLNRQALLMCLQHFWAALLIGFILLFSLVGIIMLFHNLKINCNCNCNKVTIRNITDKSTETINYIATYIMPFVYDVQNDLDILVMIFIFIIIYFIFINSSLVVINPVLAIWYGLYEIEYLENGNKRSCIVIASNKNLNEGEEISIYEIGRNLYFSR